MKSTQDQVRIADARGGLWRRDRRVLVGGLVLAFILALTARYTVLADAPQAAVTGICDRTEAVQGVIQSMIAGAPNCEHITAEQLAGIDALQLGNKNLLTLRAGDFAGLSGLRALYLQGNRLTALPQGLFDDLINLRRLQLGNNELTSLRSDTFSALAQLRRLWLHRNSLTQLPAGVFAGLSRLERLNLSRNRLTALRADAFAALTALHTLALRGNVELSGWPVGVFDGLSVQHLDINDTGLDQPPPRPNIIVIYVDDLGYNDVSYNGATQITTTNIDRLAANGVIFESGFVNSPVCTPSRGGLLTGRYASRFGLDNNIPSWTPDDPLNGLPLSEKTVATYLQDYGYRTGMIGKWIQGTHESLHPLARGFDYFFGFLGGGHHYWAAWLDLADYDRTTNSGYKRFNILKLHENYEQVEPDGKYLTEALTDKAVEFIKTDSREPFFLYLAHLAPHGPFQAPDAHIASFAHIGNSNNEDDVQRRTYLAMIDVLDEGVGQILTALEEAGELRNTLIFFLSDNGGDPSKQADNSPWRGRKGTLWEGGIHVPFLASWPGGWPVGVSYEPQVISLDIAATALAVAGAAPDPDWPSMDGVNLDPYVRGAIEGVPHAVLYWRRWSKDPTRMKFAVRTNEYKLIRQNSGTRARFFDFTLYDEWKDVASDPAYADEIERLSGLWNAWNRQNPPSQFPTGDYPKTGTGAEQQAFMEELRARRATIPVAQYEHPNMVTLSEE